MIAYLRGQWRQAAIRDSLFHATTPEAARAIMIGGFILPEKPVHGADYGIGVYLADWGGIQGYNRGAVIECGLTPGTRIMFTPEVDYAWKMSGTEIRAMAEIEGYHGIDDGDIVCVFNPTQVKPYRIIESTGSRERTLEMGW